jgi:hypothetical protein
MSAKKNKQSHLIIAFGSDWKSGTVSFIEISSHCCPDCPLIISIKLFGLGIQFGLVND